MPAVLVAGLVALTMLVTPGAGTASGATTAAPGAALSVRITSPLGRLGQPGRIRIVARVIPPPDVAVGTVRFYVNDALVGDDGAGPPYAVEWTDENPFEPARIRVEAKDANGNVGSDSIELAPFEFVDITGVSRVLLEATVMDKAGRFVTGLDAASFHVLEDGAPQAIDLASIESLPVTYTLLVDSSQSMHNRMTFVRSAAGRLADFLRPKDRIIVAPFARALGAIPDQRATATRFPTPYRQSSREAGRRSATGSSRRRGWEPAPAGGT